MDEKVITELADAYESDLATLGPRPAIENLMRNFGREIMQAAMKQAMEAIARDMLAGGAFPAGGPVG